MKSYLITALAACVVINHLAQAEADATLDAYIAAIIIAVIVLPMDGDEKNRDDEKLED